MLAALGTPLTGGWTAGLARLGSTPGVKRAPRMREAGKALRTRSIQLQQANMPNRSTDGCPKKGLLRAAQAVSAI